MGEDLNLKSDVFKLATELTPNICHEGGEVSGDFHPEVSSKVPSTNLLTTNLGVYPENGIISVMTGVTLVTGFIPTANGFALAQQTKVEPTENEAVSTGSCEESRKHVQNAMIFKQIPIMLLGRIDSSLANSTTSVSSFMKNAAPSLTAQLNVENTEQEESSAGPIPQESNSQKMLSSAFEKTPANSSEVPVELGDSITRDNLNETRTIEFDFPEICEQTGTINTSSAFEELSTCYVDFKLSEPFSSSDIGRTEIETMETPEAAVFPSTLYPTPSESAQSEFCRSDNPQVTVEISNEDFLKPVSPENCTRKTGLEKSEEKPFSCNQCPEFFLVKENLDKHSLVHSDDRPFFSAQLSAKLTAKGQFNNYVSNLVDESDKEYFSCSECSAVFVQMRQLILHSRVHCDNKLFSCDQCQEQFSKKRHLLLHLRSHSNEKTFLCEQCKKQFSCQSGLKKHINFHHKMRPLKCIRPKHFPANSDQQPLQSSKPSQPFLCKQCPAKFKEKSHLTRHLRTHAQKSFYCKKCRAKFQSKHNLAKHMLTHPRARPFCCKQCKINFSSQEFFDKHFNKSLTCFDERPFSCEKCVVHFKTEDLAKMHMMYYHCSESPGNGACA